LSWQEREGLANLSVIKVLFLGAGMKKFYCLFFVIVAAGCASTPPPKYEVPGLEESNSLTIQDLRPNTESQQKSFSLLVTSKAYAIYRIGEDKVDPKPLQLLQHRVHEKFGADARNVKVHHLVNYSNLAASLRRAAWGGAIGGVIGSVVAGSTKNQDHPGAGVNYVDRQAFESVDKEYKLGRYTKEENPKKVNMLFTYVDLEVNDKRVFIRRIVPLNHDAEEYKKTNVYLTELDKTFDALLGEF